ncbi:DNA/RNA polymerase superfamily protein [Dorcoceras hygrometricum]|uniref:DNA/RNA polymerase superfamily protein n=1 Tax=Dorcoceras hygrometricum TaxID=472368 RepID=A0A2Z7B2N7_9LAMI|nr:DNA/RNA polymerase superfamily protein [Dorcoceras hygrometricum]
MPPRRGRGRTVRCSAEGSRASVSKEGVQQVEDVTRHIGGMELVLAIFRPTTGRVFQPALDMSHSFQSPQGSQQSNCQRYRPRGKQFKKRSNSSSSASVSSGGSGSGGGVTCGQCEGRCARYCHKCGQPGHFRRVCPLVRGQSSVPWSSGRRCVMPEKSNAIIGVVTIGFECLPPSCDGLTGTDDHGPMISIGRLVLLFIRTFFPRFLPIPAFVFDGLGGAEFPETCSFNCYQLESLRQRFEGSHLRFSVALRREFRGQEKADLRVWRIAVLLRDLFALTENLQRLMNSVRLIDDLIESHIVTGRQLCHARKVQRYHRSGDCRIRVSTTEL